MWICVMAQCTGLCEYPREEEGGMLPLRKLEMTQLNDG